MIDWFRTNKTHWIIRVVIIVAVGGFIFFSGFNWLLINSSRQVLLTVNGDDFHLDSYYRKYNEALEMHSAMQLKGDIKEIPLQIIEEHVENQLFKQQSKDKGITISDTDVKLAIQNRFRDNVRKSYDKQLHDRYLKFSRQTQLQHFEETRSELAIQRLVFPQALNFLLHNGVLNKAIGFYDGRQSVVDFVEIDNSVLVPLGKVKVTKKEVEQYYKNNKDKFFSPEKRDIDYVVFKRKSLNSIKFLKKANTAVNLLHKGKSLEEVAITFGLVPANFIIKPDSYIDNEEDSKNRNSLKDSFPPDVVTQIFAIPYEKKDEVVVIVDKNGDYWFVRVVKITPSVQLTFDKVKKQVTQLAIEEQKEKKAAQSVKYYMHRIKQDNLINYLARKFLVKEQTLTLYNNKKIVDNYEHDLGLEPFFRSLQLHKPQVKSRNKSQLVAVKSKINLDTKNVKTSNVIYNNILDKIKKHLLSILINKAEIYFNVELLDEVLSVDQREMLLKRYSNN